MSTTHEVKVPDIGDFDEVDVIEVLVEPGQEVDREQSLITLESDKATLEVPSPESGTVEKLHVGIGDKVSEGSVIATLRVPESAGTGAGAGHGAGAAEPAGNGAQARGPADTGDETASAKAQAPSAATPDTGAGADIEAGLVVLGSGPGGYTAAFRAADLGLDVALVERYPDLGGICLNVGCIPSKALLHAGKVVTDARDMSAHGIEFGEPRFDLDKLRDWKRGVVKQLTDGLAGLAKRRKVRVVRGSGRFVSANEMDIEGESGTQRLRFQQAIIAAGSQSAKLPDLPDDPRIMDSTAALEIEEIPKRLLVVGGGIIGLEMACMYAGLGSRVTVVELTDRLMPGTDRDLVKPLRKRLEHEGAVIHVGTAVDSVKANKKALKVAFSGDEAPETTEFDRMLVAVGRRPNGDRIGAENAGVEVDERGVIRVDERMRTSAGHIFAIGDLVPGPMLAHKASAEARVAAEVAAGERRAFDVRVIPSVAYTDPEVAWVGVTEDQAREQGLDYGKGVFPWSASGRALGMARSEGQTKLLFDNASGRLIGAGVVGVGAGELIGELTLAIEMGCEAEDIGLTVHAHPTLSETVMMAAEAYAGTITDLYIPKR